jgi:hypothetical protein
MTSSRKTEPTSFINVDLEVFSESDLSELLDHLSGKLCLLHHGVTDGLHHACLEVRPNRSNDEPNEFIATFHNAVSSLPPGPRSAWDACKRRVIDLGFQSGWKPNIYTMPLNTGSVKQLAELQTEFLITIYGTATACKTWRRACHESQSN